MPSLEWGQITVPWSAKRQYVDANTPIPEGGWGWVKDRHYTKNPFSGQEVPMYDYFTADQWNKIKSFQDNTIGQKFDTDPENGGTTKLEWAKITWEREDWQNNNTSVYVLGLTIEAVVKDLAYPPLVYAAVVAIIVVVILVIATAVSPQFANIVKSTVTTSAATLGIVAVLGIALILVLGGTASLGKGGLSVSGGTGK